MIDINELRQSLGAIRPEEVAELLDRLEAAEKERDFAKAEIARLHDDIHELTDVRVLDKEDRDRIVAHLQGEAKVKLDRLEAAEKELAELRSSMKFRTSLIGRAEAERDALRAKVAEMEKQEPAGYGVRYVEPTNGEEDWDSIWKYRVFAEDHIKDFTQAYADVGEPVGASTVVPLYALPGAKTQGEEK